MTTYRIKVKDHYDQGDVEFDCPEDEYILDAMEEANKIWNYSCRAGACTSCVMKLTSGEVDQEWQSILDDDQVAEGWVIICVAHPRSDCEFDGTKTEEDLIRRIGGRPVYKF